MSRAPPLALLVVLALVVPSTAVDAATDARVARAGLLRASDLPRGSSSTSDPAPSLVDVPGCEALARALAPATTTRRSRVFRHDVLDAGGNLTWLGAQGTSFLFPTEDAAKAVVAAIKVPTASACPEGVAGARAADDDRVVLHVSGAAVLVDSDLLDNHGPDVGGWFAAYRTVPSDVDQTTLEPFDDEIDVLDSALAIVRVGPAVAVLRFDGGGIALAGPRLESVERALGRVTRRLTNAQRR